MKIENVGLMSPGDMGQAVAMQIKAKGLNVYTALEQRSERTRALAREAGLTDLSGKMPSLRYIVAQRSPKENEAHGRQLCRSSPDRPANQR